MEGATEGSTLSDATSQRTGERCLHKPRDQDRAGARTFLKNAHDANTHATRTQRTHSTHTQHAHNALADDAPTQQRSDTATLRHSSTPR